MLIYIGSLLRPAFTMLFSLPLGRIFPEKIKARFTANGTQVCYCATKTETGFVVPGSYSRISAEQLEYLWKLFPEKESF